LLAIADEPLARLAAVIGTVGGVKPKKWLARLTWHLTRTKARAGWTLALLSILAYAVINPHSAAAGQFFLIVTGVAAGAIFLPELSSDLWTIRADEVKRTVPDERVAELQRVLISANSWSAEWAEVVWNQGLSPLLASPKTQVVWDLKYDITVHLVHLAKDGRPTNDASESNRVETLHRSRRILPKVDSAPLWVSVARTNRALLDEYQFPGCMARELICLNGVAPEDWRKKVTELCQLQITVGGRGLATELDSAPGELSDVVRWYFVVPAAMRSDVPIPVTIAFGFPMEAGDTSFPVLFSAYYCAGTSEISFRLYPGDRPVSLECYPFIAHGPGRSSGEMRRSQPDAHSQSIMFSTPGNSLLWPGSGVLFSWKS
jgi:hypothetical protein